MLIIEKVVKLLDDFHFEAFRNHVKHLSVRSYYPLALIDAIDRDIEVSQDSSYLCNAIYNETNEKAKKKFFQIAHYTFNLTSFLSRNYPSYLQSNLTKAQKLINSNQLEKANNLLKILLDISRKIEDFPTELQASQIMVQQNLLKESLKKGLDYQLKISELISNQQDVNNIYNHFYSFYNLKDNEKSDPQTTKAYKEFYESFFNHRTILGRIMSRYCYCYFLHYNRSKDFYLDETLILITEVEALLKKNETIIFPFLLDLYHRIGYLKLKYWTDKGEVLKVNTFLPKVLKGSPTLLYWSSFVNSPEITMLAIQASLFAREHLTLIGCDLMKNKLPTKAKSKLQLIQKKMDVFLNNENLKEDYTLRYINLCTMNALLLLCGSKDQIAQAIQNLNSVLVSYQQLTFYSYIDPVYSILGTAYFKLGDHGNVENNFKRYKKRTKNKTVNPSNDLTIYGIYYASMWVNTQKKQYAKKFGKVLATTKESHLLADLQLTLNELAVAYQIPVSD